MPTSYTLSCLLSNLKLKLFYMACINSLIYLENWLLSHLGICMCGMYTVPPLPVWEMCSELDCNLLRQNYMLLLQV